VRADQLRLAKSICAERQIAYSAHGPLSINFADPSFRLPRHFEVLLASLDIAAELGCRNYVLHAGITPQMQSDAVEDAYARQREWLTRAGDEAAARGVFICVETLFAGYAGQALTPTPARLARELAAIDHRPQPVGWPGHGWRSDSAASADVCTVSGSRPVPWQSGHW
jgi:sugar phosphate isomerase/epimerase